MTAFDEKGMGRLVAPDERDLKFLYTAPPERELTPEQERALDRGWRSWYSGPPYLDQGRMPHCVGFSWAHWLVAGPVAQRDFDAQYASHIYREAQKVDEWAGEAYDGTSVRAGAKVLKAAGLIGEYRWATTVDDIVDAVLLDGPMVVGTYWTMGMHKPVPHTKGALRGNHMMSAIGPVVGGHAYTIVRVNKDTEVLGIKNSWGRGWAKQGRASISFEDMQKLLDQDGEACIATEVRKA